LGAHLPFAAFDRRHVIDFIGTFPNNSQKRLAATVLKNLTRVARYHGLIAVDQTTGLRLRTGRPRARLWTPEEKDRWLTAAAPVPHMLTAFRLLEYTCQRPIDVLAMTWRQVSDAGIELVQLKTGVRLIVPLHPALREHLAGVPRTSIMLVSRRGRRVPYRAFNHQFQRISQLAGVDAQARDLRRTGMVNMALAGATVPMIAAVSGHSVDRCARILETYLPRGRALTEAAIHKLSEYKG